MTHNSLAAGRLRAGECLRVKKREERFDNRILPEVSREPRGPVRAAGDDKERPVSHPWQVRRVRHYDIQDREIVLNGRIRRGQSLIVGNLSIRLTLHGVCPKQ